MDQFYWGPACFWFTVNNIICRQDLSPLYFWKLLGVLAPCGLVGCTLCMCLTGWYQPLLYTRYVGPRACMYLLPVLFLSTFFIFLSLSTNFIRLGQGLGVAVLWLLECTSALQSCLAISNLPNIKSTPIIWMPAESGSSRERGHKIGVDPLEFILKYINKFYIVHLFDLVLCKWVWGNLRFPAAWLLSSVV